MIRGAAILALAVMAGPAAAEIGTGLYRSQTTCGPIAEVAAWLPERFGEAVAGEGLTETGQIVTLAHPDGWACVLAAGREGWEALAPVFGVPG